MKFMLNKTKEVKEAVSITQEGEQVAIQFSENGKVYRYFKSNITLLEEQNPLAIYALEKDCYRCGKSTTVYTYLIFSDDTGEGVTYPWDQERLLRNQNVLAHIMDESIEYYGLDIVGTDDRLDRLLEKKYPKRIQKKYSATTKTSYYMNLCQHCGTHQGANFIYRQVNQVIAAKATLPIVGYIEP